MKRFVTKAAIFSLWPLLLVVALPFFADGTTDIWYLRFTTPKQNSMIIGTSIAACGIRPDIVDSVLAANGYDLKLYNYSFTIHTSPYGPAYLKSIENKLDEETRNGVFLVTVDPTSVQETNNDSIQFPENSLCVGKTQNVCLRPNFEYFYESYSGPLINVLKKRLWKIIYKQQEESEYIHANGWLELTRNMDTMAVQKRINASVEEYGKFMPHYKLSQYRYDYLQKTIECLKQHGTVYLIYLPEYRKIRLLNDEIKPGFDSLMTDLAVRNKIVFFNLKNDNGRYRYTDGYHIFKESTKELSREIGEMIVMDKN